MGIFQSDMTIKTAIELGINDMRKETWLLDDALSDAVKNPWLKDKYGQKQIDAFKEWFLNNEVPIYMRDRNDKDKMPCISISLGNGGEKDEMKTMADQSTESVQLLPQEINKPIPYVVKPFDFISYDINTGAVEVDPDTKNLETVVAGQILVDPDNGEGYLIHDVTGDTIYIEPNLDISPSRLAVVPKNQFYTARREHTWFQETYSIVCHAHGDPQTVLWLWTIAMYALMRYRESMLEAQGFTQSSISYSPMDGSPSYTTPGGEQVWIRVITLTGMVEASWIKAPKRTIESIALREKNGNKGYKGGIKILSNSEPDVVDQELVEWYAIDSAESESEET